MPHRPGAYFCAVYAASRCLALASYQVVSFARGTLAVTDSAQFGAGGAERRPHSGAVSPTSSALFCSADHAFAAFTPTFGTWKFSGGRPARRHRRAQHLHQRAVFSPLRAPQRGHRRGIFFAPPGHARGRPGTLGPGGGFPRELLAPGRLENTAGAASAAALASDGGGEVGEEKQRTAAALRL